MSEEDAQRKFMQLQMFRERLQSLSQTKQLLQDEVAEIQETLKAINEIEDLDDGEKMFFPLGSSSYGFGKLMNTDEVLVNVGGDAMIKTKNSRAREILEEKKEEFKKQVSEVDDTIGKIQEKLQNIQMELQNSTGR